MTIKKRIGFACKWMLSTDPKPDKQTRELERQLNTSTTTVAWLRRQSQTVAEDKLWSVAKHNLTSVQHVLTNVAKLPAELHFMRLSSDLLPMYTEPNYSYFWQQKDVQTYCASEFAKIGDFARTHDIRLSFHPGQFCCIVSDNDDVVKRSIEELEYHSDMIRMMGFGKSKLDFKLNVHLSGKRGIDGFINSYNKMSTETRNCLTLENDEYSQGLNDLIALKDKIGIVLDIHHHLIKDEEYIQPTDHRISHIKESWQGIRPVIHYSQSKHEYIHKFENMMPSMTQMLNENTKSQLRQHSDFYKNKEINKWALTHLEWADIMAESKAKNLASIELLNQYQKYI